MAKTITLPSGRAIMVLSNGIGEGFRFEFLGPPYSPQQRGVTVDVRVRDIITLSDEDVARLADELPICAGCGEFKLKGHDCPVEGT